MEELLRSSKLAKAAGVTAETVRHYERLGLLVPAGRTGSGHRRFGPEAVSILQLIRRAQDLGFTLAEIRGLLRDLTRPSARCESVCDVVSAKLERVEADLEQLQSLRTRLRRLRDACPRTRPLRECPVVTELTREPKRGRR